MNLNTALSEVCIGHASPGHVYYTLILTKFRCQMRKLLFGFFSSYSSSFTSSFIHWDVVLVCCYGLCRGHERGGEY